MNEVTSRNELVLAHRALASSLALRYYRCRGLYRWHDLEDVQQEAFLAMLEAAPECDLSRPEHEKAAFFKRRVCWWLSRLAKVGGLVQIAAGACQASASERRREQARKAHVRGYESYDEGEGVVRGREEVSAEDRAAAREAVGLVMRLPERQRRALLARFGLEDGQERTLEEVGKSMGVSRQSAYCHEQKALEALRELMGQAV